jgi:hypothetical protein
MSSEETSKRTDCVFHPTTQKFLEFSKHMANMPLWRFIQWYLKKSFM